MLGPHHAIKREFQVIWFTPEDVLDVIELIVTEPERSMKGRIRAHAATWAATKLSSNTRPSALPSNVDIARSGCGIKPTTLPRSLAMPATSSREPFGFSL